VEYLYCSLVVLTKVSQDMMAIVITISASTLGVLSFLHNSSPACSVLHSFSTPSEPHQHITQSYCTQLSLPSSDIPATYTSHLILCAFINLTTSCPSINSFISALDSPLHSTLTHTAPKIFLNIFLSKGPATSVTLFTTGRTSVL
jgi:hypothetical protein